MTFVKKNTLKVVAATMLSLSVYAFSASESNIEKVESDSSKQDVKELVPQKTCPIMGGGINKKIYADYEGQRVYFCCGGCDYTFKADPEKYIKELEARGEGVEKISLKTDEKSKGKKKAVN